MSSSFNKNYSIGKKGEKETAYHIINSLNGYIYFNSILLEPSKEYSSKIDHIVIGPNGIFHIDSKTLYIGGTVRNGMILRENGNNLEYFSAQMRRHNNTIMELLKKIPNFPDVVGIISYPQKKVLGDIDKKFKHLIPTQIPRFIATYKPENRFLHQIEVFRIAEYIYKFHKADDTELYNTNFKEIAKNQSAILTIGQCKEEIYNEQGKNSIFKDSFFKEELKDNEESEKTVPIIDEAKKLFGANFMAIIDEDEPNKDFFIEPEIAKMNSPLKQEVINVLNFASRESLAQMKANWNRIIKALRKSSAALFVHSYPVAVSTNAFLVVFKYDIHSQMALIGKEEIENVIRNEIGANLEMIVLSEGKWLNIREEFLRKQTKSYDEGDPLIDEAKKLFGTDFMAIINEDESTK